MGDAVTIATEHGNAVLWWDDQDPDNPGWVLRQPTENGQHLDEPFDAPQDPQAATTAALVELGRQGIGAGEQLTTAACAELAGLSHRNSWWGTRGRPAPSGRFDQRTPWWWESLVRHFLAIRPGQGHRSDLPQEP